MWTFFVLITKASSKDNFFFSTSANCPDIFILHLHVAVYGFFLRLYGMFPCTLVSFLRINYAKKENLHAYNEVIVVSDFSYNYH